MRERVAERGGLVWLGAVSVASLAAALWLRQPAVPYASVVLTATAVVAIGSQGERIRRGWRWGVTVALVGFLASALVETLALRRVDADWPRVNRESTDQSARTLAAALGASAAGLRQISAAALSAGDDGVDAFAVLDRLVAGDGARSAVLFRRGRVVAWSGVARLAPDTATGALAVRFAPFYVVLQSVSRRGDAVAVAAEVLHADPPADRIAPALDRVIAARVPARGFTFSRPVADDQRAGSAGAVSFAPNGVPIVTVATVPLIREEVRLRILQRAVTHGLLLLALALLCFIAAEWRRRSPLIRRLGALAVVGGVVAIAPLSALSNATSFFDPTYYYAALGGPFTASVGALGITSALVLLALLAALRARPRPPARWMAIAMVSGIAGLGPFLLRDLARGVVPPPWGVTTQLWLAWQVTIFLAAESVLLAGASAGRAALGRGRGLPAAVPVLLAAAAALLAPILWMAPGRWPGWYPVLWVAAIGTLAVTRRTRRLVATAATVAGFGAVTLVWGATTRGRVDLAARDLAGLQTADEDMRDLLDRFGRVLSGAAVPTSRAELLRRYVSSSLSASDAPIALTSWTPTDAPRATLDLLGFDSVPGSLVNIVRAARRDGRTLLLERSGVPGTLLALAVPFATGDVVTAVAEPRTRLLLDDPFGPLLGLGVATNAEPPYSAALGRADSIPAQATNAIAWRRIGNELHGDRYLLTGDGWKRAHVEVDLRSPAALVQRGALIVLLDLIVLTVLWIISSVADGGFLRLLRLERRRWGRSYRIRLTLVLFGFFVLPALVFALWSARQLQSGDRTTRELQVRETLRAIVRANALDRLGEESDRLDTPLLLYVDGALTAASDSLYELLSPMGVYLPPDVAMSVAFGGELTASAELPVGERHALFGYWSTSVAGGHRLVLSAPARTDELMLDRRRRDLGVLVLFATALGAIAALGLSGAAARELSRPIGTLRSGALAIAAGEREPELSGEAPSEFAPVFSAFRRMVADLSASRRALEEAERRTAAVLSNVASGVVAVDSSAVVTIANPRAGQLLGVALRPGDSVRGAGAEPLARMVESFLADAATERAFELLWRGRELRGRLTALTRAGGAVVTLDDVSEVARAQRVLAWGEMARQVAHEIKNPLTPIRLGVQHLVRARSDRRGDYDAILEQNAGRILAEIDRLDEIARAFSRYGLLPEERTPPEPVDVRAVVGEVVDLERLGSGNVQWRFDGGESPIMAMARRDELHEVLLNLLENARHAGAREVSLTVGRGADGAVVLAVQDDGEGIPADVLPRVFEPHFSTRTSGSGLGLAISRRLVDGWGGSVTVDSTPGRGTRVTIQLLSAAG